MSTLDDIMPRSHSVDGYMTQPNQSNPTNEQELRERAYKLALELVEYEFHSPKARYSSEIELARNYTEQILELLAQEKAKWVAELRQQLERSKKIYVKHGEMVTELNEPPLVITTDYKYMVDWSVIAKLLDKKGGENE